MFTTASHSFLVNTIDRVSTLYRGGAFAGACGLSKETCGQTRKPYYLSSKFKRRKCAEHTAGMVPIFSVVHDKYEGLGGCLVGEPVPRCVDYEISVEKGARENGSSY